MGESTGSGRSRIGGVVAAFLFIGLSGGLVYSALQIRDLTLDLSELRRRVTRTDALPAPKVESAAPQQVVLPSVAPKEEGDLAAEVARLRKDLEELKASIGSAPSTTAEGTPALLAPPQAQFDGQTIPAALATSAAVSKTAQAQEAFKTAVLQVMEQREKEEEEKKREKKKNEIVEQLTAKLGLTDTQKDSVQRTIDQASARIAELRKQMNDQNQEQTRNDIRATMTSADQGVRMLLTVEQTSTYDAWKAEQNPRKMFGLPGGGGGGVGGDGGNKQGKQR